VEEDPPRLSVAEERWRRNEEKRDGATLSRSLHSADVCRLLVVDDSVLNVKMIICQLKGAQSRCPNLFQDAAEEDPPAHRVEMEFAEADDGLGAVALVQRAMEEGRPFDVVFMDSVMVQMQGPDAAQAMRAMGFAGMIVGVTGNVMADDVAQYLQSGADQVLFKPIVVDELDAVLNMFIRRRSTVVCSMT
jgi:CheY-like chemotaxis protein